MRKLLIMALCLVFGLETWAQDERNARVVVDLGSAEGAYKGLHMGVYTVKTVAGKEARYTRYRDYRLVFSYSAGLL